MITLHLPSRQLAKDCHFLMLAVALLALFLPLAPSSAAQSPVIAWNTIDRTLSGFAPQSNLLVAEFAGSSCRTIHARDADSILAIASTFKLYVLGELARQVQLGEAAWDDRVTVDEGLRSMPSGDYAWVPAGTRATVRDLAEAMIWNSDNTATDHLIDYLGRDNVQRAFAAFGHSDPGLNAPLLLTREMFGIKMSQTDSWMREYMSASDEEQLEMVQREIDPMRIDPDGGWGFWNGPTAIEGIEWFASATDLCRAVASLWSLGAQPGVEPVRDILTGSRNGIADIATWPRAGYKGGYESGVVNMTYVLERSDGRVFFVSAGYNQPHGAVSQTAGQAELDLVFACLGVVNGPGSCADTSAPS
jgi:Beta-lactamase enzyme family